MSQGDLSSPASAGHSNASASQTPPPTADAPAAALARPASSRAIVPTLAPLTTNITPRVTTATASSPLSDVAAPSPAGAGPTSASYVVPPRPKPGRKPATDEPASKRKAQNRESQRAFRARKAAKLNEMQTQVEHAEHRHKEEISQRIAELHESRMRIKELEAQVTQLTEAEKRTGQERDFWKDRSSQDQAQCQLLERQMREMNYPMNSFGEKQAVFFQTRIPGSRQDSPARASVSSFTGYNTPPKPMDIGCGNCKPDGECACIAEIAKVPSVNPFTPAVPLAHAPPRISTASPMKGLQIQTPADPFADREIDFTTRFATKRSQQVQRPSIAFITESGDSDSKCGFCTDESNCLCKDESLSFQDLHRKNDDIAVSDDGKPIFNDAATTGPGSCADCQVNPRQRAWCQRVAQLRISGADFFPSPTSRTSSIGSVLDTMEPRIEDASTPYGAKQSIGCSEAFKLLDGRVPMDQDRMDWIGNLKPVSPTTRQASVHQHSRKYSALELDTASVIATLGSTMQPLQSRPSDGENAPIVRLAQEFQSSGDSPRTHSDSPLPISSLVNTPSVSTTVGAPGKRWT